MLLSFAITLSQEYMEDFRNQSSNLDFWYTVFKGQGVYESMNNDLILQSYFNILLLSSGKTLILENSGNSFIEFVISDEFLNSLHIVPRQLSEP